MDQSPLGQLVSAIHDRIFPRRHTALLVAIVVAFAVRPLIGDIGIAPIVFSIALVALMLTALYIIQVDELVGDRDRLVAQKKRRSMIGWLLAIPAIAERLAIALMPSSSVVLIGMIFWLLFLGYVTWNEFRAVLRQ